MRDPDGERFEDLAGAHALGALGRDERLAFENLIRRRPDLRREAENLRRTADLLAFAGPSHGPPEGLGEKVLLKVLQPRVLSGRTFGGRGRAAGRGALLGAAVACAGLLLAARLHRSWAASGGPGIAARPAVPAGRRICPVGMVRRDPGPGSRPAPAGRPLPRAVSGLFAGAARA